MYVVPAGPVAFSSIVNVSPIVTSLLLAVAVTLTGEGGASADGEEGAPLAGAAEAAPCTGASASRSEAMNSISAGALAP